MLYEAISGHRNTEPPPRHHVQQPCERRCISIRIRCLSSPTPYLPLHSDARAPPGEPPKIFDPHRCSNDDWQPQGLHKATLAFAGGCCGAMLSTVQGFVGKATLHRCLGLCPACPATHESGMRSPMGTRGRRAHPRNASKKCQLQDTLENMREEPSLRELARMWVPIRNPLDETTDWTCVCCCAPTCEQHEVARSPELNRRIRPWPKEQKSAASAP